MSRTIRSCRLCALLALTAGGDLFPLQAQVTISASRTFDFGQPLTLVRSGTGEYKKVTSRRTATELEVSMQSLYSVALFVDSAAFRNVLRKRPDSDDFYKAVREAEFPIAVVLTMSHTFTADEIAQQFAEDLKDVEGSVAFLGYFEAELGAEDEVVLRVLDGQVVKVTAYGKEWPDIRGRKFARALLGIWIGSNQLPSMRAGLFSRSVRWVR